MNGAAVDQDYRERRLELGKSMLTRQRVYLDTCFWIRLRDLEPGDPERDSLASLLKSLIDGVESGRIICPIEGSHLIELFKQNDPVSRERTVHLMDRLSQGNCLAPPEDRRKIELMHFLRKHTGTDSSQLYEPRELVWTRVADIFGSPVPDKPSWTAQQRRDVQAGFQAYLWGQGVRDVMSILRWTAQPPMPDLTSLVKALNEEKVEASNQERSIEALLRSELAGGLDALADVLRDPLVYPYSSKTGREPSASERMDTTLARQLARIIHDAYRKNTLGQQLPSLTIPARLHAAKRWDRSRKYRNNDIVDFWHAAAALPYCDVFVADNDLAALITSGTVQLDRLMECRVVSTAASAIEAIGS